MPANIPESTPKILYELAGEGHFSWGNPGTNQGGLVDAGGAARRRRSPHLGMLLTRDVET